MQFRADFIDRLKQCLEEADDWYGVDRCFRGRVNDEEVEDAKPLIWAFGYMLVGRRREEPRERSGVFAPQSEFDGSVFPPRLAEIPQEVPALWAAYAKALDWHPLAGRLDESWRRYLVNALNDSLGLNLRDLVSHGLYGPVSRADAAIALHITLQLRSWSVTEGEADKAPEGS